MDYDASYTVGPGGLDLNCRRSLSFRPDPLFKYPGSLKNTKEKFSYLPVQEIMAMAGLLQIKKSCRKGFNSGCRSFRKHYWFWFIYGKDNK